MVTRTIAPYMPHCDDCVRLVTAESALRGWNVGKPRDVFAGRATFVACDAHQDQLDGVLFWVAGMAVTLTIESTDAEPPCLHESGVFLAHAKPRDADLTAFCSDCSEPLRTATPEDCDR